MKENKFAIIGAGHFGSAIAMSLAQKGAQVLVIDSEISVVENLSDDVEYAVCIDATNKRALEGENITDFDTVVVAIGNDFQARLLCTANLLDMNIKRIICRTMSQSQRIILEKMGIQEFLSPEDEIGTIFAERLMNPGILSYLQLPDEYKVVEVLSPPSLIGETVYDIDFRNAHKLSLITIHRTYIESVNSVDVEEKHIIGVPENSEVIQAKDVFILFGKSKDIERFIQAHQ